MRSLNAIQRSACSCGGKASHLFSIFASVGLEMAWVARTCPRQTGRTSAAFELRMID